MRFYDIYTQKLLHFLLISENARDVIIAYLKITNVAFIVKAVCCVTNSDLGKIRIKMLNMLIEKHAE